MKSYLKSFIVLFFFLSFTITSYAQQLEFMGLPLHSNLSKYVDVLSKHGFKDKYTNGELAHLYWESGHFWTQRGCYVDLHCDNDKNVELITVLMPYSNFQDAEIYGRNVSQLITDIAEKYGSPNICSFNMEDLKSTDYWSLYDHDHNGNKFTMAKWSRGNGELVVVYNNDRIWTIKLLYTTIERINKIKKAKTFKGQGKSDL